MIRAVDLVPGVTYYQAMVPLVDAHVYVGAARLNETTIRLAFHDGAGRLVGRYEVDLVDYYAQEADAWPPVISALRRMLQTAETYYKTLLSDDNANDHQPDA